MPIKCSNCGFDDNRDVARFCKQCGKSLTTSLPTPVPPQPLTRPGGAPPVPALPGGTPIASPQACRRPPQVEGRILYVDGPHKQKKGSVAGKFAVGLALSRISPFLGWLPFMTGMDVDVRYVRVLDLHSGQQRSVKIAGEPSGDVSIGDIVAFWGRYEGGTLDVQSAYNHSTGALIRLKR